MELDMKKDIKSTDKISEGTFHEILLDIKYRLDHIEDITADDRAVLVKLVKQSNQIVKFLAQIDIEPADIPGFDDMQLPNTKNEEKSIDPEKYKHIKEMVDEFMEKRKDLKELEEELKKHKDKITPGQVGDA